MANRTFSDSTVGLKLIGSTPVQVVLGNADRTYLCLGTDNDPDNGGNGATIWIHRGPERPQAVSDIYGNTLPATVVAGKGIPLDFPYGKLEMDDNDEFLGAIWAVCDNPPPGGARLCINGDDSNEIA